MENIQNILEQTGTKTSKIKMLLQLGMTRKQVAEAMGVGYGFVQNVYAPEKIPLGRVFVRQNVRSGDGNNPRKRKQNP